MPQDTERGKPAQDTELPLHLLIDTCVWLDLAKDYRQRPTLAALERLVEAQAILLIVPQLVMDEFKANKDRVVAEGNKSLSGTFRRVREAIEALGVDDEGTVIEGLREADHRLATHGQGTEGSIERVAWLLQSARVLPTTQAALVRAGERALLRRAPFHKSKNSMGDAVIIELFAEAVKQAEVGCRLAFVTHNKHDFSAPGGDERLPHPDLAALFGGERATYSINLAQVLNDLAPDWMEDLRSEFEFEEEPRRLSEILEAESLLFRQVWYNRHWNRRIAIEEGRVQVVPDEELSRSSYRPDEVSESIWKGALAAAKRTEEEVGMDNLGPWTDFEWGMVNGKLSALRWVLGVEWDMLDT